MASDYLKNKANKSIDHVNLHWASKQPMSGNCSDLPLKIAQLMRLYPESCPKNQRFPSPFKVVWPAWSQFFLTWRHRALCSHVGSSYVVTVSHALLTFSLLLEAGTSRPPARRLPGARAPLRTARTRRRPLRTPFRRTRRS